MALPPELIRIKRRRDEEPVDSLFIHTENEQKRRRGISFFFQRLKEDDTAGEASRTPPEKHDVPAPPRRTVSGYARPEVPVVRATLPGEELLDGRPRVGSSLDKRTSGADSNGASTTVPDPPGEDKGGAAARLFQTAALSTTKDRDLSMFTRRFHLKKTASTFPSSRAPASGIQKRKKGQRPDIAEFVEKGREPTKRDRHRGADSHACLKVRADGVPVVEVNGARPRKRPGTGTRAVIKKRGAEQGGREDLQPSSVASLTTANPLAATPGSEPKPESRDQASSQLAEDLHRATLQPSTLQLALTSTTRLDVRPSAPAPASNKPLTSKPTPRNLNPPTPLPNIALSLPLTALSPPRPKPKVPPLDFNNPYPYGAEPPPPQLSPDADSGSSGDERDNGNEGDYVYDTYIRQRATDGCEFLDRRRVGVLVISQADEKLWATYGVDEGKEGEGWGSEESDENAEYYHANDYPDEELDSEDEVGRGAYGFRRNASDGEEFDEDEHEGVWSDDEEAAHPWNRRNPWAVRGGEGEDSEDEGSD